MTKQALFADKYSILSDTLGEQSLLELLMKNRGVDVDTKEDFLHPKWESNHDPFLMHNMREVVDRVWQAIEGADSVVVYSDYDADGVPGAVILSDFFKKIGFENYTVYIPNRNTDGFGLNETACESFVKQGVDLLITIDCGISDLSCIKQLQQGGVEVVVTDHHLPSVDGLPDCLVLDPKQPDCTYPCPDLCGSGVIFKLVQAMMADKEKIGTLDVPIKEGWEKWLLDMVGLATICDMVPLVGENRVFAHYGLQVLRKSPRVGLRRILDNARTQQATISPTDCGFSIGPRINAASRLGDPMVAYRALSGLGEEALVAADELEALNKRRKSITAAAARAAYKKIDAAPEGPVVVVGDTDWPLGIVGLIAGSVASKYNKPAFVWTRVGDAYKGSVRSGGSCSIHELMHSAGPETFVSFGGHAAAGGFVCDERQIHTLGQRLQDAWGTCPSYESEKIPVDSVISIDEVHKDNWEVIKNLEPCGLGNPAPLFVLKEISVDSVRVFGKDSNHLSLSVRNSRGWTVNAIRFNYATLTDAVPGKGDVLSLVVAMEMNAYNGASELRLRIEDIFV